MPSQFDNPLFAFQKNLIDNSASLSGQAMDAIHRLTYLQLQTLKVTFDETGSNLFRLFQAEDATAASAAIHDWFEPTNDKFQAWLSHVDSITTETGTKLAELLEKQIAGSGHSVQAVLEAATVESSAGSQGVFPWMQPALFDSPAQIRSEYAPAKLHSASRRPRNSGSKQVK